ncbi:protein of unknown function [Taphrina deformans PYCC 5710]|uniref:TAFII55 protein conserved region domain-containing protein n=1 Tax=Taphrina deformans (strain PYCC 5710 / ATCC 11124 / CBS 356.35 / IMI 108563 / JCM 9778 / NBRC 8474) TaxID=1097556 RepID=R4XK78_TAPDE|nr:protein of unknown function [Taphrina deformans PYCC 5710]|eukprot:CCG83724.1 protein of unknown function [Taphrina deformans PYCC 5710]
MFKIKIKPPSSVNGGASPANEIGGHSGPATPTVKQPGSGKIVLRKSFVGGYGYDSEASDKEEDPLIENHIILRFKSENEAEFVRGLIDAKGSMEGLSIKFKDARNAVVTIQKKLYAAKLVDLPTITEVHKSFDKKNVYKVADVCQMLLVGDRISHEDTVLAIPTQPKDFVFPHGLTPPLRNVRTRRFRKRASAKTIESVEKEVDRLFSLDANSEQTTYTIMDKDELVREQSGTPDPRTAMDSGEDEDEEMEEGSDYEDLAADLEAQLNSPLPSPLTPSVAPAISSALLIDTQTPSAAPSPLASPDVSDDGSDVGSDEDEDATKDQAARKTGQKALRESITNLQHVIANKKSDIDRAINPIMKQRLITTLRKFESELEMKMAEFEEAEGRAEPT